MELPLVKLNGGVKTEHEIQSEGVRSLFSFYSRDKED